MTWIATAAGPDAVERNRLATLTRVIPAGMVVLVTKGEYSSFAIADVFTAVRTFCVADAVAEWQAAGDVAEDEYDHQDQLLAYLEAHGYLVSCPVADIFLGPYAGDGLAGIRVDLLNSTAEVASCRAV
jgi:hypothetical protein